ncbi:glucose 1-dehydrogenase [Acidisoma cellulosilytica]|uniref:Glucose 1-dehydrogenase n=1 Tax=Acidisoma cellulosilyticum TaxID=2802395 RepID=A0A964E547_9PROT|nr:glucose 1-dehydrogenase [Acidisoma cellulosilyticum]MCB8882032.1 glucose 1-dehydrogenase [Acidisoma cellulosilyticum]
MSESIKGRAIIVTGAGRGIGAAMAHGLAADGAFLVIADRDEANARGVAEAITEAGGRAMAQPVDVTQRASVREMIKATVTAYDRLDVIFNNAGIAQTRPFLNITEEDWDQVMDVNAKGVLIATQEAARQMIDQGGGGKIINTASIAGKQGYDPLAHYCASKFAVVALTQAAARAFGKHRINVNAICPGVVATDMWKVIDKGFVDEGLTTKENEAFDNFASTVLMGRPSRPEDMVGVARFLASSASDYMTGQSLMIDGGMVLV